MLLQKKEEKRKKKKKKSGKDERLTIILVYHRVIIVLLEVFFAICDIFFKVQNERKIILLLFQLYLKTEKKIQKKNSIFFSVHISFNTYSNTKLLQPILIAICFNI